MTEESAPEIPPDLASLRAMILTGTPRRKLDAIEAAALLHEEAADLVPLLTGLLTSDEYVPCYAQKYDFSGHAPLAFEAMRAIESIRFAPEAATLRTLLADSRVFALPEASYDQGAYIGDYGQELLAPAGLAARLVPMMGQSGFELLPELFDAACSSEDQIGKPARLALERMACLLGEATSATRSAVAAVAAKMATLPEAMLPTTHRGFDLRDLAILLKKKLAASA